MRLTGAAGRLDSRINHWVRQLPLWWRTGFRVATLLGEPLVMGAWLALGALAYRRFHDSQVITMALAGEGAILGVSIIKLVWKRERPDTYLPLFHHSYSFPSGHAYATTLVSGILAWLSWLTWGPAWGSLAVGAALTLSAGVGLSRMYLGAHHPTDVIGGWFMAGFTILLFGLWWHL